MKIYLGTWLEEKPMGDVLSKVKVRRRLLSFYRLQTKRVKQEQFRKYILRGTI